MYIKREGIMVTQATEPEPKNASPIWIVLAVLLALTALGALWWWTSVNKQASATCKPESLELSIGPSQSAESTTFTRAVFTNKSKETCMLKGYPVASMLDTKGENRFTSDAQQNNSYATETITLRPRDKANAVLGFPEANNFRPGTCGEMVTLRMYLPADAITPGMESLSTPLTQKVCPGFSVTALRAGE